MPQLPLKQNPAAHDPKLFVFLNVVQSDAALQAVAEPLCHAIEHPLRHRLPRKIALRGAARAEMSHPAEVQQLDETPANLVKRRGLGRILRRLVELDVLGKHLNAHGAGLQEPDQAVRRDVVARVHGDQRVIQAL